MAGVPAAPAKLIHVGGVLLKQEAVYNTAETLAAATDGFLMHLTDRNSLPVPDMDYLYDGDLGLAPGNLGIAQRTQKRGRFARIALPAHSRGSNAAYSATVLPSLHRVLLASGMDAAIDTTLGSEKVTYTPTAAESIGVGLTGRFFARKEQFDVQGILADWSWSFEDGAPPLHTFSLIGTMPTDVQDIALPAITYAEEAIAPAPSVLAALTLGNMTPANARVLTASWALGREYDKARGFDNAGAHMGFVPGGRAPQLTVALEATALQGTPFTATAAFDGYKLNEMATPVAVDLAIGTAQYLREKLTIPVGQVISATPGEHNGTATMELVIAAVGGDFNLVFD